MGRSLIQMLERNPSFLDWVSESISRFGSNVKNTEKYFGFCILVQVWAKSSKAGILE
jgi:hypothetical protein